MLLKIESDMEYNREETMMHSTGQNTRHLSQDHSAGNDNTFDDFGENVGNDDTNENIADRQQKKKKINKPPRKTTLPKASSSNGARSSTIALQKDKQLPYLKQKILDAKRRMITEHFTRSANVTTILHFFLKELRFKNKALSRHNIEEMVTKE